MIKKSFCCSLVAAFTMAVSAVHAQTHSMPSSNNTGDTRERFSFPSKTHFLMAVDRQIASRIQYKDVSDLVGIQDMPAVDELAIYRGMRKAMLQHAAKKWDAGVAEDYGRKLAPVVGWRTHYGKHRDELQNRLMMFRFAQESKPAKRVLERYDQEFIRSVPRSEKSEAIRQGKCRQKLVTIADYVFYQHLGASVKHDIEAMDLALLYETLQPCERVKLEHQLAKQSTHLTEAEIEQHIIGVQSPSESPVILSYSQDHR